MLWLLDFVRLVWLGAVIYSAVMMLDEKPSKAGFWAFMIIILVLLAAI